MEQTTHHKRLSFKLEINLQSLYQKIWRRAVRYPIRIENICHFENVNVGPFIVFVFIQSVTHNNRRRAHTIKWKVN